MSSTVRSEARDRILATAARLFYAEGIHAIGIDRIIAESAVAKATFYRHFPSKDSLVVAYLQAESGAQRSASADLPAGPSRERVLAIFDSVADIMAAPNYRGCPFVNAAAEFPDPRHPVRQAVADHRRWFRGLVRESLQETEDSDLDTTVDILVDLKDGLLVGSDLDNTRRGGVRDTVSAILDRRLPTRRAPSRDVS